MFAFYVVSTMSSPGGVSFLEIVRHLANALFEYGRFLFHDKIQYCAKVMQTIFGAFRRKWTNERNFGEFSPRFRISEVYCFNCCIYIVRALVDIQKAINLRVQRRVTNTASSINSQIQRKNLTVSPIVALWYYYSRGFSANSFLRSLSKIKISSHDALRHT